MSSSHALFVCGTRTSTTVFHVGLPTSIEGLVVTNTEPAAVVVPWNVLSQSCGCVVVKPPTQ